MTTRAPAVLTNIQLTSEPTYEENDLDNDVRDVKVGHRRLQGLADRAVVVV